MERAGREQPGGEGDWDEGQVWGADDDGAADNGAACGPQLCGRRCAHADKGKAAMPAYDSASEEEEGGDGDGDDPRRAERVEALFQRVVLQDGPPAAGDAPRAAARAGAEEGGAMAAPECSICYEPLDSYDIAFVSGCMHVYCIDCILKWCALTNSKYEAAQQQQRRDSQQQRRGNVRVASGAPAEGAAGRAEAGAEGERRVIWCPTCKGSVNSLLTYRRCFDDALCDDLQEETVHWWMITRNNKAEGGGACCFEDDGCCEDDYHYDYGDDDEYGCFKDAGLVKRGKMMGLAPKKQSKKGKKRAAAAGREGNRSIMISNRPFGKNGYTSSQGRQFARPIGAGGASSSGAAAAAAAAADADAASPPPAEQPADACRPRQASYVSPATLKRQAKKEKKLEKELLKLEKRRAKMSPAASPSPLLSRSPSSWTRPPAPAEAVGAGAGPPDELPAAGGACT